jgi:hypothetical protein
MSSTQIPVLHLNIYIGPGDHVNALRHKLMDRPVPSTCPNELFGHMISIYKSDGPKSKHIEDGPHLDILRDLAIRWIAMPRTLDEVTTLASTKCWYYVDACHSNGIHNAGVVCSAEHATYPQDPISALLEIFLDCLLLIKSSYAELGMFNMEGRKTWPTSVEQFMPYGPERTVRGILPWLKAPLHQRLASRFLALVQKILEICAPVVLPFITATPCFLDAILAGLKLSADVLSSNQSAAQSSLDIDYTCGTRFDCIMALSATLCLTNEVQIRRFLGGRAQELLVHVSEMALRSTEIMGQKANQGILGEPKGPTVAQVNAMKVRLAGICGSICDAFPQLHSSLTRRWQPMPLTYGRSAQGMLWVRLIAFLLSLERVKRCRNPGCANVFWNSKRTRACGKCRRIMYCSRRCQRHAWSHPDALHREICAVLRAACSKYGLSRSPLPESEEPSDATHVGAAQVLAEHFIALATVDMKTGTD